jgi:ABC-type nitrate/sulfonate/bicarbonate transport system substrate-binding protein
MNRRFAIAISAVVLIGLVIAGYFLFRPTSAEDDVVRIGVLRHESSLPIYIADEFGLFEAHDVQVELVELPPGDHMPALLSGRVDILSPTSFPVLFGVMHQHPGTVYAVWPGAEVLEGPTVYGFVVRNDSTGTSISDLRGRTVMAINTYTQINIQTILTSAGIPRDEWPEIRVANREAALGAVADGTAQAAIMDQPGLAVALASGDYRLLEANPRARHIGSPYWSGAGAVTQERWSERRDDLMRVMEAIDDALQRIKSEPEAAHRVLSRRLGIDERVASQMGGYYFPKSNEAVPLDGIRATVNALVLAGLLPERIDLSNFFPPGLYGRQ